MVQPRVSEQGFEVDIQACADGFGKAKAWHWCDANAAGEQPPPEKCAVNARANEPKPPRVTLPGPDDLSHVARSIPNNKNPAIRGGVQSGRSEPCGSR
ncbi:MAG: hypothetical protein ACR2GC_00115 [Methyloceanibacter sp.]|jgi:hypothetical protein